MRSVQQLQQQDMATRIQYCLGFIILGMKGFMCNSYGRVLRGTFCIMNSNQISNFKNLSWQSGMEEIPLPRSEF
jgi:hypothetical protein